MTPASRTAGLQANASGRILQKRPHMPGSIVYAPLALEDLDAIWDYLSIECGSTSAAIKVTDAIISRIDLLSDFPESGMRVDARCIVHSNYRFVVSGHYLAFYRAENECVYVDRILDSRSDYLRKLFGLEGSAVDLYVQ